MLRHVVAAAVLAAVLMPAAPAFAAEYDDDAYWAFADRMQQILESSWDAGAGYYRRGGGAGEPMANSMMLLLHSVAAMQGHVGPARNDVRARDALQLDAATVTKIRNAIHRTAHGPFWRYPAIRLNQINWYTLMYAADATATGDATLPKRDMPLQLRRFFAGAGAGAASRIGNF